MPAIRIVGLIGSHEVCRYSLMIERFMERGEVLEEVLARYPHLKCDTGRIYIDGIPASRYEMGQSVVDDTGMWPTATVIAV